MMQLKRKFVLFDQKEQMTSGWYEIIADDGELIYVCEQLKHDRQWEQYITSPEVTVMEEWEASGIPPRLGHSDNYGDNSLNKNREI